MKKSVKKNKIVQGTFGRMREVKDFLPAPDKLVLKKPETVKVTMTLNKYSVEFFKQEAKRLGSSYQRMIRVLLNEYAARHQPGARGLHA
jgi:predicted DNA binding CopG/RHH family protein